MTLGPVLSPQPPEIMEVWPNLKVVTTDLSQQSSSMWCQYQRWDQVIVLQVSSLCPHILSQVSSRDKQVASQVGSQKLQIASCFKLLLQWCNNMLKVNDRQHSMRVRPTILCVTSKVDQSWKLFHHSEIQMEHKEDKVKQLWHKHECL